MTTDLDIDDVAATSPLAAAELADLRASAARLALERAEFRREAESLRAQVATLTAELAAAVAKHKHDAGYIEGCNESFAVVTAELARVKALVEGTPVEWRRYKECRTGLIYNDRHSISGEYELIELIARPNLNLEQKP